MADDLVGASTGAPLADHAEDFAAAFKGAGLALEDVFYCAESVLLPQYRGQGLGHWFFDLREAHAKELDFAVSAFCSVQRPDDHPAKPQNYRDLHDFWRKRGYQPMPGRGGQFFLARRRGYGRNPQASAVLVTELDLSQGLRPDCHICPHSTHRIL